LYLSDKAFNGRQRRSQADTAALGADRCELPFALEDRVVEARTLDLAPRRAAYTFLSLRNAFLSLRNVHSKKLTLQIVHRQQRVNNVSVMLDLEDLACMHQTSKTFERTYRRFLASLFSVEKPVAQKQVCCRVLDGLQLFPSNI
jgi:hypothetical protein